MKSISTYVNEKLRISTSNRQYAYVARTRERLIGYLEDHFTKDADCNDIDVSYIDDMRGIFGDFMNRPYESLDISRWDVSYAENMKYMFLNQKKINPDLSEWDVSNVKNMTGMFEGCSSFNSDISEWNVSNVEKMFGMFIRCSKFNQDISGWDVHNVENMSDIFALCSDFNQDLSKWKMNKEVIADRAFYKCNIKEEYKFKV